MSVRLESNHQPAPQIAGTWRNIRWVPNASTGEVVNLGVLFESDRGEIAYRLLGSFDRIACMYDKAFARESRFLVQVLAEALDAGLPPPTQSIVLSEPKFASGVSPAQVVDTLFQATVPLARPRSNAFEMKTSQSSVSTDSVREVVLNELRRISGLSAGGIINSERRMQVSEGGRVHYLDIPLQGRNALGTIVSAQYARATDNELQLLRATGDLQIARSVYSSNNLFMYVVRSEENMHSTRLDDAMTEWNWRFSKIDIQMKSYLEPTLAAHDILEDMSPSF